MHSVPILAFLNIGLTETIVVVVAALLLFGPRAGRAMGSLGRSLLNLKKDIEDTKDGIRREIKREIDTAIYGPDKTRDNRHNP